MLRRCVEARPAILWAEILAIVFGGAAVALQIGKASVTLVSLSADFSLSVVATAMYLSCISLCAASGGWAFGFFAQKVGIRSSATIGLAIISLASAAGAAVQGFGGLMAVRIAEAVALLMFVAAAPAILREATRPGEEAVPFGLWAMWMPLGLAPAMLLGIFALEPLGWRSFHLICAVPPAIATLLMLIFVLPRQPVRATAPRRHDALPLHRSPEIVRLAICFGLFSSGFMTFAGFLPALANETMGLSLAASSMLGFWAVIFIIPGNLSPLAAERYALSRRKLLVGSLLTMAAMGIFIFSTSVPAGLRIAASLIFASAAGTAAGILWASIPALADETSIPAPAISALFFQSSAAGQLLGPLAAGALVQATGDWGSVAVLVASATALGALLPSRHAP